MNGYFVTGTDTDVGKTYVACALARRGRAGGHRVFAFKPIETGCAAGPDGELVGADQELLAIAAGDWQRGPLRGVYRFPLPAAPFVAARQASRTIDLALLERTARDGSSQSQSSLTIVEGAGGWRVPITPEADMSTLARSLGLPVLVVARARLGTINHTLLTLEAIERDGLRPAAVVLSQRPDDETEAALSNRDEIRRCWRGDVLILQSDPSLLDRLLSPPPG
ncbi:MAG TPA: dethiobiotin synthase [Kofleriaceae bacterium]|jgi:dethiobiotin synthetase